MRLSDIQLGEHLHERFWLKVDRTGECWLWTASQSAGYGSFSVCAGGRVVNTYAHRIVLVLLFGELDDDLDVCHRCDEKYPPGDTTYRLCVNPSHLFTGTASDNIKDCYAKGRREFRGHSGDSHPCRRLSVAAVQDIRQRVAKGESQASLAREYAVSGSTVHAAVHGKNWARVE